MLLHVESERTSITLQISSAINLVILSLPLYNVRKISFTVDIFQSLLGISSTIRTRTKISKAPQQRDSSNNYFYHPDNSSLPVKDALQS